MQIIRSDGECGTYAIASRPIPAGELVLACKPLVCLATLERIRGNLTCCGCFATIAGTAVNARFRCTGLCGSTFCSEECWQHNRPYHLATGECAVLHAVSTYKHSLRSWEAGQLAMVSALIARAVAEGWNLPTEPEGSPALVFSNSSPASSSKTASVVSSAQVTPQQEQLFGAPTSAVLGPSVSPTTANPPTALPAVSSPQPQPKQVHAAANGKNNNTKNKKKPVENNDRENEEVSGGDDEEEEEDDDEEDEQNSTNQHQPQEMSSKRKGKQQQQHQQQFKKSHSADKKKKKAQQAARNAAVARAAQQRAIADGNAVSQESRLSADIRLVMTQPRASISKVFSETLTRNTAGIVGPVQLPSALCWAPPTSQLRAFKQKLRNRGPLHPLQVADAAVRNAAIAAAPQPTFSGLADLISNADVLPKAEVASYETLRRKYIAMSRFINSAMAESGDQDKVTTNSYQNYFRGQRSFFIENISTEFFRHLCSAYRCNAFGLYDEQDDCLGLAIYPEASFFNHSCAPNLLRRAPNSADGGRAVSFYAARDIGVGEPLCISYIAGFKTTAARREHLLENYRFWCRCALCEPEGALLPSALSVSAGGWKKPPECDRCAVRGELRILRDPATGAAVQECQMCFKTFPLVTATTTAAAATDAKPEQKEEVVAD